MKPFILLVMIGALTLTACKKDDDSALQATQTKILGKWKVFRYEEEYYNPISTLSDYDAYDGEAGDSLIFKSDGNVHTYTDSYGEEVYPYELKNANTLVIESEIYKISKLTDTELTLYSDETDKQNDERYVLRILLIR